ncbi:MAG: pyruvate dehydrogenase (acetyl-transferring), homodimeric type [Candidatus Pelagibacter sp. TMED166]|nr:MAG: pyruvate dehydrogenase (acetyl-transferring), homodimeric type [Candidatus Pelagibacter sp. TMED166]|tara:strand:- start:24146 stop:27232 length:3087 start_codon:yes stop_codon:yes gene_type:complete
MIQNIVVPDIGDFENVEVIEVLVDVSKKIDKNDPIVTLESDKSSVEVPSTMSGTVESVKVKVGDKVSKGDLLITLISESKNEIEKKVEKKEEKKQNIPNDTEKIINEAEKSLKKEVKEEKETNKNISKEKKTSKKEETIIQTPIDGDLDPLETREWLESLSAVLENDGKHRAQFLIKQLIEHSYKEGSDLVLSRNTPYINTIPPENEAKSPGDQNIERKIRSLIRWNAAAMVVRANKKYPELGGHIGTFASAATLFDVGMNHFWRAKNNKFGGDLIYFQGHSAPGVYARSYLEGRLTEKELDNFRQEVKKGGLSSYPHPWLMPKYWQFPTVSMGLGPMLAIYQARFMKYLINRGLIKDEKRKVWVFLGDGEMDEPESLGAIGLAARENLDNLIFVINCNLQRLDGPVRGNGKIIQELEGIFRGAGWNVIKVIWGSYWDQLLANDKKGLLVKRMNEAVDGEYQAFKANGGSYVREHFFGKYPELKEMVSSFTDKDIWKLNRGGHDPHKVFAAYHAASKNVGSPTVIIAKTIKGYGMGKSGESINTTHQQKKLDVKDLLYYRDRFDVPLTDKQVEEIQYYKPDNNSEEIKYLKEKRLALGGFIPERSSFAKPIKTPPKNIFDNMKESTGEKEMSTTMALVRMLTSLLRDKNVAPKLVPIIPDEARTFGMEGFFQKIGIYAHEGQKYEPVDFKQLSSYREDKKGQVLEEGITEAGSMSSWIAAGTSYSNHDIEMIPIYLFYSMFGFQRVGDLAWAAGDSQARGFLIGATSGRTTLAGEGLQHQDGHSHLTASTIPNCVSYDPTFAYELAVIFRDGLRRMYEKKENIFYYITTMNENYTHPAIPKGQDIEKSILKGMYKFKEINKNKKTKIQLLGSGTILREMIEAAEILSDEYKIDSDIWSVTSFNELRKNGLETERYNLLNPNEKPKKSYLEECLNNSEGPVLAASDYMRLNSDQIRPFTNKNFYSLGTDGYGRSDTRKNLRNFFEVDKKYIVTYALSILSKEQLIASKYAESAIKKYNIDKNKPMPTKI